MSRGRKLWFGVAVLAAVIAAAGVGGILVLRSSWFAARVHDRVVQVVETATGGRVEMGAIQVDWRNLRARVAPFTLHGTEPPDKPPLFRADSLEIGLKVLSLARRDVNLRELQVTGPRVYLIVSPDGRTNVPEPKLPNRDRRPAVETILDLAIGQFQLENGAFEIEGEGSRPFGLRGRNLSLRLAYDLAGPRYRGELAVDPLDVQSEALPSLPPLTIRTSLAIERNRVALGDGHLRTPESTVEFTGAVENLADPRARFPFHASVSVAEARKVIEIPELRSGSAQVEGTAEWTRAAGVSLSSDLHATRVLYRDSTVSLHDFRVDGALSANADRIELAGARLAGVFTPIARPKLSLPVSARVARATLRGRNVDVQGIDLAVLEGSFEGAAQLRNLRQFHVEGQVAGFDTRRLVALYSPEPLPWDGLVSGSVQLDGTLGRADLLRASGQWDIRPAPGGAPVNGHIEAAYDAASEALDLGRSTLALPASRVEFSGALGSQMHVHLETHDLAELLPAAGESAASLPVKLQNGAAVFDGTVTGKLDAPRVAGHLHVTKAVYDGRLFDTLEADVAAASDALHATNGSAAMGPLKAQFHGDLALTGWKAGDSSLLNAAGSLEDGNLPDLLALVKATDLDATGTVNGAVQVNGTVGNPIASGNVEVTGGAFRGEPFDRFAAQLRSEGNRISLADGQIIAGRKQVGLAGTFDHPAAQFDAGRVNFQVSTNAMQLEEIRTLETARPGVQGTVTVTANGAAAVGGGAWRLSDLHAEVAGRGLQLTGQALGDAAITANSAGNLLRAHLQSNFAGSRVEGTGEWRLDGDDPGSATIDFSRMDFAQLRDWIAPPQNPEGQAEQPFAGFAEGQLRIDGPLMKPAAMRAELRIPSFEIRSADTNGKPATPLALTLRNSGPIVARLANSVVTVETAHLVGRATDLTITGKASLQQNNPLDLKVKGQVDLAILHDLDRDFTSSGTLATDAAIRGTFSDPQIAGQVQFENSAFSLADFPNGVSNANGSILFTKERATIQRFSGETGGGKVTLSGFASYGGGSTIYRLHANVDHVRVRYPEGVSTVADASLSLTGTRDQSMLAGTVTVLRASFSTQSDFSSIIARSAEPVRTPAAQTGLLGGMSFAIQITTSPDIQLQSSLTEDLEVEANLTLRGTPTNPALLGRISITEGRVLFYGTKYNINQGSVSFFNPLKVEPILDIDLETRARGIDVTLTVSGPLTHLNLTPRSDPPLQFNEIVALLATGATPTSDPTLLAQQAATPQSWQQMGASALLGQAIASPVAGRLQRFFGVSNLRIDPTLQGVENNPQARLTLEQQVTPAITFTYITNVTSSNPEVVRVEWALNKQWSVVALREENGVFGIDFYLKKRF